MAERAPSADPIRILLVDDDAENRRTLLELLEGWGLVVLGEAADGAAAVSLTRELAPDVVLMDVRMPVMDGIEATGIITRTLPECRVVLLTSEDDPSLRRRAEEQGAFAHLSKTSSARSIHEAILRARRSRGDATARS